MINKEIYTQGSLQEYEDDGDPMDQYYLPSRALSMSFPNPEGIFVLPENDLVKTYAKQLASIQRELERKPVDPVYIPDTDYLLDVALAQHIDILVARLDRRTSYRVMPYAITGQTLEWIHALKSDGYNVTPGNDLRVYHEKPHDQSHRGGWGRHVSSPGEASFPQRYNIPYPVSWIASSSDEIAQAYERVVNETGNPDVFFKPVFSAGGFTLKKVSTAQEAMLHYNLLKAQGALDICGDITPIEMQEAIQIAENGLLSLQYNGSQIDTPGILSRQIIVHGVNWAGNIFNESDGSQALIAQQIFHQIVRANKSDNHAMTGQGGIDFARTTDGKLVVLEQNARRVTGGHPAIALAKGFGVENNPFLTLKSPGEVRCDLSTLWNVLKSRGLQYEPSQKRGIFPIVWMQGSGMLWVTGGTSLEIRNNIDLIYHELERLNYIL